MIDTIKIRISNDKCTCCIYKECINKPDNNNEINAKHDENNKQGKQLNNKNQTEYPNVLCCITL